MPMRCRCSLLFLLPLLAATGLAGLLGPVLGLVAAEPAAAGPPRLAVLLVFDQMRGDYLGRWEKLFGERGFRRLQQEGAWYTNCHYPYSDTITAAGHASIATGTSPAVHGIIENNWYERASGKTIYCVTTGRYERVPPLPKSNSTAEKAAKKAEDASVSPERLLAPTLGDAVKEGTAGKGRVVALSLKDRSAVLPAGRRPDACYWFDTGSGSFVTSSYYRTQLHPWVAEFNRRRPADRWFGKPWQRFRPDLEYAFYSGPDDVPAEAKGYGQGRTFPHPMTGGKTERSETYYQAVVASPFGNELLLEFALRALKEEHLGQGEAPDFLSISFSSNDYVGHSWGPDSQEVLDATLRSDKVVQTLLDQLDAKVGKGRYVLVLTADHGVCPLPEVARSRGKEASRIPVEILGSQAEAFLNATFGRPQEKARWIEARATSWVYLNRALLQQHGLESAPVEAALAGWLKRQPGIETAYTRTELLKGIPADDRIGNAVRLSFFPERSGDVTAILKPYCLFTSVFSGGTTHGTPHPYDTHVPLLVYGPGVPAGIRTEAVTPQATATILARALGIAPPAQAAAALPKGLFPSP